jgi:hypothetical protein
MLQFLLRRSGIYDGRRSGNEESEHAFAAYVVRAVCMSIKYRYFDTCVVQAACYVVAEACGRGAVQQACPPSFTEQTRSKIVFFLPSSFCATAPARYIKTSVPEEISEYGGSVSAQATAKRAGRSDQVPEQD